MKNTQLKYKLQNNKLTIGSWLTIGHPTISEILAPAGFDWLAIDIEHNNIDFSMVQTMISTIQSYNIAALVRVSKNEEVVIKRVLDAGADGIIVPMVNSREDAEKAVNFVKYPPEGTRGVGLSRAQKYGAGFEQYVEWLNSNVTIIAQIEHIDGVEKISDVISTTGIDAVIIGPYDLSGSLGCPGEFDKDIVKKAVSRVEEACKENNFPLGYHVIQPNLDLVKEFIGKGYTFIAFSTDFYFLSDTAKNLMKDFV
jgi:2-dehydro-3-deoxyglucarate aldolase